MDDRPQARLEIETRYRELTAALRRFIARRMPASQVEDIISETFTRAFGHIDAYRPTAPLESWLRTIAANLITDHHRRRAYRERLESVPEVTVESTDIDAHLDLERLVATLPPADQRFIDLRFRQDWLLREIAVDFGHRTPWASRREVVILDQLRERAYV